MLSSLDIAVLFVILVFIMVHIDVGSVGDFLVFLVFALLINGVAFRYRNRETVRLYLSVFFIQLLVECLKELLYFVGVIRRE